MFPTTFLQLTEYYLGRYDANALEEAVSHLKEMQSKGTLKKPHKMRIENLNMPYYQLIMGDGTLCDLSGQPRVTRVNYVCYPAGETTPDQ